jgi:hypothetical protein
MEEAEEGWHLLFCFFRFFVTTMSFPPNRECEKVTHFKRRRKKIFLLLFNPCYYCKRSLLFQMSLEERKLDTRLRKWKMGDNS